MNRLQQLREAAGLNRADLARRSDVTQSAIEQLEAGVHLTGAERAVEVPGETTVEDLPVLLNKLADALGANLIDKGIAVSPDELLEPARVDAPTQPEGAAAPGEETQTALPLIGVNYAPPEGDLPPDARSHNETETPEDIDAALDQLARNAQITASEAAAETGADEVTLESNRPATPVSPAAETGQETAPDYTEPARTGQAPTGGTETINMAELPDSLPIGVLPGSPPVVETREISPLTDQEFASQETQKINIPAEVQATLPGHARATSTVGEILPATPVESANRSPNVVEESDVARGAYAVAPAPDMPGPAPAPETMQPSSEAHPEPPVTAAVENEAYPANLGLETSHKVDAVEPNRIAMPAPPPQLTSLELEAATPPQDDAPLTTSQPEKLPVMQPYVTPGPTDEEQSRYKLPLSTVIPSLIGVVAALGWYAWRTWRRSKAESERVAPYYREK